MHEEVATLRPFPPAIIALIVFSLAVSLIDVTSEIIRRRKGFAANVASRRLTTMLKAVVS